MRTKRLASAAILFTGLNLHATIIGDHISLEYHYPDVATLYAPATSFEVLPGGTTLTYDGTPVGYSGGILFDISVNDDSIRVSRFQLGSDPLGVTRGFSGPPGSPNGATDAGVTFNGLIFTDPNFNFPAISLASVTALPDFDASRVSANSHEIALNFMGISFTGGASEVVLSLGGVSAVPEGGSSAMMFAFAFGSVVLLRARVRQVRD